VMYRTGVISDRAGATGTGGRAGATSGPADGRQSHSVQSEAVVRAVWKGSGGGVVRAGASECIHTLEITRGIHGELNASSRALWARRPLWPYSSRCPCRSLRSSSALRSLSATQLTEHAGLDLIRGRNQIMRRGSGCSSGYQHSYDYAENELTH
jgi:hypothetical protein